MKHAAASAWWSPKLIFAWRRRLSGSRRSGRQAEGFSGRPGAVAGRERSRLVFRLILG